MNYDEVDFNPNDIWDTDFYEAASLTPLRITSYLNGYQVYRYTRLPF